MKQETPISSGEATFEAMQSAWSRAFVLAAVAWFGVVVGYWLTQNEFNIWAGNPLSWLYYQSQALKSSWGFLALALQILAFYVWAFTDTCRFLSLATSFVSNGLQMFVVNKSIKVDPNWFVCAGLGFSIIIGTFVGWWFYRTIFNRTK